MCRLGHLGRDRLTNLSAGAVLDVYLFLGEERTVLFSYLYVLDRWIRDTSRSDSCIVILIHITSHAAPIVVKLC